MKSLNVRIGLATFFRPEKSTWQDPAQGGGFAYGQMSHCLALMFFLTGLSPETVSAQTFGLAGLAGHVGVPRAAPNRNTSCLMYNIS